MARKMLLLLLALGTYSSITISMDRKVLQDKESGSSWSSGELSEDDYLFGELVMVRRDSKDDGTMSISDRGYDTEVSFEGDPISSGKRVSHKDKDQACYSSSDDEFVSLKDAVKSPLGIAVTVAGVVSLAAYGGNRIMDLVKQSTSNDDNSSQKKPSTEDHSLSFEKFKVLAREIFSDPDAVCDRVRRDGPYVLLDDSVCREALLQGAYKQSFCAIL